jgi:hypothetical protein
MTSEAKIAANRRNALRSTGPRTAAGKTRVRRNALRHGLAAVVAGDPAVTAEVERVAVAICGEHADPLEREQALIVAEAQMTLKQIHRTRAKIIEQLSPLPPTQHRTRGTPRPSGEWIAVHHALTSCCGSSATSATPFRGGSGRYDSLRSKDPRRSSDESVTVARYSLI